MCLQEPRASFCGVLNELTALISSGPWLRNTNKETNPLLCFAVKPGPVNSIRLRSRGPSWLTVSVKAPKHFDLAHFNAIPNKSNALAVNYTVELLSPKEQSLLHHDSKQFSKTYGFVRNLEEDEAALRQTLASDFRHFSGVGNLCACNVYACTCAGMYVCVCVCVCVCVSPISEYFKEVPGTFCYNFERVHGQF